MPQKCSVPLCKGNYNKDNKVHVFSFPKENLLCQKWIRASKKRQFYPDEEQQGKSTALLIVIFICFIARYAHVTSKCAL